MYGIENWVLSRDERRETETREMRLARRVSRYALTGHICNALQIFDFEEKNQRLQKQVA
jgi:hypothetical protein